jgi:hypothetical protein
VKKGFIFILIGCVLSLGGCSTVVQKQNEANTAIIKHDLQTAINHDERANAQGEVK